jgi:RimJ/RimL family protein N-acetyltransferase/predicted enzyme related to lactoylglutathione lyase
MAGMPLTATTLHTPTLHTARLRLRPFTDADADALFALHSNAYVLRFWDSPPWGEPARAERFIAACRQMADEGTGARLAMDRVSDGAFVGWCGLTRWNRDYRSASLGYCLGESAWGHGYATEGARAVVDWAFHTLDLNRVQAETDTRNVASARVLGKLGFLREGTLREDCVVNGEVSDSWVFGLIRRDWESSSGRLRVVRIIPDLVVEDMAAADEFYGSYLGLDRQEMGLDWVTRYLAPTGANLQLLTRDASAKDDPVVSIAVDDVDAAHDEAVRRGYEIVHPLTTETWGVRRFFVRSPDGHVLNILLHRE